MWWGKKKVSLSGRLVLGIFIFYHFCSVISSEGRFVFFLLFLAAFLPFCRVYGVDFVLVVLVKRKLSRGNDIA